MEGSLTQKEEMIFGENAILHFIIQILICENINNLN